MSDVCAQGGNMPYSIYETIHNSKASMVNAFVTPIEESTFHWHSEYELIGVMRGSVQVRVQSEVITLSQPDILLINSNVIHAIQSKGEDENLCMVIQLSPALFSMNENDNSELIFYLDSTGEEAPSCGFSYLYKRMAKIVYESMKEDRHAAFRLRAEACALIADLFDYVVYDERFRDFGTDNYQELTIAVIEYLENHLEEEKIVDITCHEFGLSRKTLDRCLKMTIGVTGKEIIDNLRMEKAKKLLKNTNKNMNFILDACGFGSEKTFYRVFRQETGLTPKAFREKGQIMNNSEVLRGYLDFEALEAKKILKGIILEKPDV